MIVNSYSSTVPAAAADRPSEAHARARTADDNIVRCVDVQYVRYNYIHDRLEAAGENDR